jgi:hypothetical protein
MLNELTIPVVAEKVRAMALPAAAASAASSNGSGNDDWARLAHVV